MPFLHRSGLQPLQHRASGLPPWEGMANIPQLSSSSSSEPGQPPRLATSTANLLPEPPLLRLGSTSYTPDVPPLAGGATSQEGAVVVDQKNLLSTMQQLSLLGLDGTGQPGRARLSLPQMPADVWQGGVQMQPQIWGELQPGQTSAPPQSLAD